MGLYVCQILAGGGDRALFDDSCDKRRSDAKAFVLLCGGNMDPFSCGGVFYCTCHEAGRKKNCRYLIVLGAQIRGERITDSLKRRLDAALLYHQVCPSVKIIVSGGQGKGEDVSEAYAMAQYLREHEVKDEQIMLEDQSRTTRENLRFSKAYLEELKTPVGIVTNNFHLFRALLIGRSEGYENLTGIAAGCNRILFLNYMVREFFAVVWPWIQRGKRNLVDKTKSDVIMRIRLRI